MSENPILKSAYWIASSKKDLGAFPRAVQREIGRALRIAQLGGKHEAAKSLKGFKGAGVLEVVEDHDGNTYRAVYTVRFVDSVYVLHAFRRSRRRGSRRPSTRST